MSGGKPRNITWHLFNGPHNALPLDDGYIDMKNWIVKSMIAGFSGTIVHFLFMHIKSQVGLFPEFQPYQSFQIALSRWVGADVPAIVP